jgi:hypothetical protein
MNILEGVSSGFVNALSIDDLEITSRRIGPSCLAFGRAHPHPKIQRVYRFSGEHGVSTFCIVERDTSQRVQTCATPRSRHCRVAKEQVLGRNQKPPGVEESETRRGPMRGF